MVQSHDSDLSIGGPQPAVLLFVLSSLMTVPATVVVQTAAVAHLLRSFPPWGLLLVVGACVPDAGDAFYVASFPGGYRPLPVFHCDAMLRRSEATFGIGPLSPSKAHI
jgi:hypothetical protein